MNVVDWILVAAVIVFALAGWHRGFVAGLLSFVGFLGGGLLAAFVLPNLVDRVTEVQWLRVVLLGAGILVCALLGQFAASILGDRLRGAISWKPVRRVDNLAGALLNVLALAVIVWIVASALVYLPVSVVSQQVNQSRVLVALDSLVPPQARNAFGSLRNLVATTEVPRIFSGLAQFSGPDVAAPDPGAVTERVDEVRDSVVQVFGDAAACGASVSGSGWVFDQGRVVTNAHVVAGVDDVRVRTHLDEPGWPATVVYFDPATDIAVLDVPGVDSDPIRVATRPSESGDEVVVAGFPESGPFRVEPARIRTMVTATGDDIYGSAGVDRQVYVLRGTVRPGNSGGPLLRPDGVAAGMVFGASAEEESTGYALTLDAMADALGTRGQKPVDTGTCRVRD